MTQTATTKSKQRKDTRDIRAEALKIVNTIKTEGQTPVETKAIANGIQRGMEMFLRQQSEKSRELDKRTKKVKQLANQLAQQQNSDTNSEEVDAVATNSSTLPWILLGISWVLFLAVQGVQLWGWSNSPRLLRRHQHAVINNRGIGDNHCPGDDKVYSVG